jgi:hypothetical protein
MYWSCCTIFPPKLKERDWKIRSTKVDTGNFKHELLNRLWSILAVNVLILLVLCPMLSIKCSTLPSSSFLPVRWLLGCFTQKTHQAINLLLTVAVCQATHMLRVWEIVFYYLGQKSGYAKGFVVFLCQPLQIPVYYENSCALGCHAESTGI